MPIRSKNSSGLMRFTSRSESSMPSISDEDSPPFTVDDTQRSRSRPTSFHSVDVASIQRRVDDHVSFEPTVQSRRDSVGTDSHHSAEMNTRKWRYSLPSRTNDSSAQSSMKSRQRNESIDLGSARASSACQQPQSLAKFRWYPQENETWI